MKVGIIGLRGVGKTTVFCALTGAAPPAEPGGKLSVHLGRTNVPDARVDALNEIFRPKKTTYASIDFVDIGGMSTERGKGLEAEVLNHLRATDALVQVVQAFENPASPFRSGPPDPLADLEELNADLLLSDLLVIEKRLARIEKERNADSLEYRILKEAQAVLESDRPLRVLELTTEQARVIAGFRFLTQKPMLVLVNLPESAAADPVPESLARALADGGAEAMPLAATMEAEIAQLPAEEQQAFLADLGVREAARDRFIQAAYALLDLVTFLTVGEDEVRAWPIPRGTTAVDAAGTIHSDLARGFIRAEVVAYEEFLKAKSMAAAKSAGVLRLEGKDYVVQDGDILHVRFNI